LLKPFDGDKDKTRDAPFVFEPRADGIGHSSVQSVGPA
jgi:hypothetical protein